MDLNKETILPAIETAVRNSFETSLFFDFDKAEEVINPAFQMADQVTHIKMREPFSGEIYLVIGYDFAFELIKTFSNEQNENALKLLVDETMAEICNTVAGQFMSRIVPQNQEFNFSLPACSKIAREKSVHKLNGSSYTVAFKRGTKELYCIFKN